MVCLLRACEADYLGSLGRNRYWNVDIFGLLRGKYLSPAFAIKVGETAIRNCFRDQLAAIRDEGVENMGNHPCVFTEIGIPYDMDDKYAYKTGDYSSQVSAMDANHFALEGSRVSGYAVWVYMTKVRLSCHHLQPRACSLTPRRITINGVIFGTERTFLFSRLTTQSFPPQPLPTRTGKSLSTRPRSRSTRLRRASPKATQPSSHWSLLPTSTKPYRLLPFHYSPPTRHPISRLNLVFVRRRHMSDPALSLRWAISSRTVLTSATRPSPLRSYAILLSRRKLRPRFRCPRFISRRMTLSSK